MAPSNVLTPSLVDDDSWRRELCPDCGMRLFGFRAWRDHAPHHGWGADWLAARVRAARPGEIIRVDPGMLVGSPIYVAVEAVEDATWKLGIPV